MTIYQSKPSLIEAIQWTGGTGESLDECRRFADTKIRWRQQHPPSGTVDLFLLAGADGAQDWVPVPVGHWLVSQPGDRSDIWPVDPDYFAAKYEERKP